MTINTFPAFCLLITALSACQPTSSKTGTSPVDSTTAVSSTSVAGAAANDFLIVPGERVGPITAKTSEADLLEQLGKSIVTADDTLYGPEGSTFLGTTLYKGTPDEVHIIYSDERRSKPETVLIRPTLVDDEGNPIPGLAASQWHTTDGLRIGTTLKELEQRNGKPFKIWGFAWDYGGVLSDWQGGQMSKLAKKTPITITFGPPAIMTAKQEKAYNSVMGDSQFVSSIPDLQVLNPIVVTIGVGFDR